MRKQRLLPLLTCVFSLLGLTLRQLQLRRGFDVNGLPVGSLLHLALPACTLLFLLGLAAALALLRGGRAAPGYDEAFSCPGSTGYMTLTVCTAALLLLGFALTVSAWLRHTLASPLHLALGALMAASGCCLVGLGRSNYRRLGQGRFRGGLLLAAYTCALWLILTYQQVSGEPILQRYLYRLLAIIFSLLAFYFTAGFSFEKGRPLPTLWTGLGAVYFCCVTLLDDHRLPAMAFLAGFALYFLVHSAVLLRNLTVEREESTDE